jgi:hypothetical protein
MFPSFSNGQRKREIIKKLEEDNSLLQLQVCVLLRQHQHLPAH